MANRIHVLDEAVINRIAAGEVVERPVSVVKELVENSIDAGATSVQVDIENGGKKLIRVRDNGSGMSHDDAFLAVERHATSKLRSEKDLIGVATLGFRGEALASIASVSRLKLMTCDGVDAGVEIAIEGGVFRKSERIGMGRGTLIEVQNLFFNVPVRRKFLKGVETEAGLIQDFLGRIALAFPAVALTYREDGRLKIDAPPGKTALDRIQMLYSKDVRDNLMTVDHSEDRMRVHGYIARPPYARSNMRSVQTFVNGRSVKDKLINSAVTRSLSNLIERGRYPLAVLFLEVPADHVDINVHPQKTEVRFMNPQKVFGVIADGIHMALTGAAFTSPAPRDYLPRPSPPTGSLSRLFDEPRSKRAPSGYGHERPAHETKPLPPPAAEQSPRAPMETTKDLGPSGGLFSSLGVLGALPGSFLVLFSDKELIVLDQHAAHERVLFEKLKSGDRGQMGFETQTLLIPAVMELKPLEARAFAAHIKLLTRMGFWIEEFGRDDFVVKGIPAWLENTDTQRFFDGLIEEMLEIGLRGDPNQLREELLKRMACRAAIKETKSMSHEEIRGLLADLDRFGSIEVCPHGRPIAARFSLSEIRRRIGRR